MENVPHLVSWNARDFWHPAVRHTEWVGRRGEWHRRIFQRVGTKQRYLNPGDDRRAGAQPTPWPAFCRNRRRKSLYKEQRVGYFPDRLVAGVAGAGAVLSGAGNGQFELGGAADAGAGCPDDFLPVGYPRGGPLVGRG